MMGRTSCCWDSSEEHGWRGGGAIGAQPSRGLLFRWEGSGAEEEHDEEAEETTAAAAAAAGSGSRQLTEPAGGDVSGPTAPCSTSPAAACSPSRVGEEGGEGRAFFLLESSFRRLFFSFCSDNSNIFFDRELQELLRPKKTSNSFKSKDRYNCTHRFRSETSQPLSAYK